jgi:predicted ATPase
MKITVNKFAQIHEAKDIEIRDFNVFIGKNGSGKTYFAKLLYFLNDYRYNYDIFRKHFEEVFKKSFEKKENIIFTKEQQKVFLTEVTNHLKKQIHIYLGTKKETFKNFDFRIINDNSNDIEISFSDKHTENFKDYFTYSWVELFNRIFLATKSSYLPAARANYMITYKYLFESEYNSLRNVMLKKKELDDGYKILPEIENTFLKEIYNVDTKNHGFLFSLGTKIENDVLTSGKLSIRNPKNQELPTYEYKLKNSQNQILELVAASSAVTELSPLIMYFRHQILIAHHELLIIDEPELSLHPDAQQKLVSILVEAVNEGLKLILVTHSPYIIEALNNHLLRAKINDYSKLPAHIKKIPAMNPKKVSTYLFENNTIKNIFDDEVQLIDDKLLSSFNTINDVYNEMRDIEWSTLES